DVPALREPWRELDLARRRDHGPRRCRCRLARRRRPAAHRNGRYGDQGPGAPSRTRRSGGPLMSIGWRRGLLLSAVLAAALSVAALLATGLGRDPAVVASPLVGREAPAFKLEGLDGPAVSLSDLRGQVVV